MVCNGVFSSLIYFYCKWITKNLITKYLHGVHPTNLLSIMVYGELHMEMFKNLILITINVLPTGM